MESSELSRAPSPAWIGLAAFVLAAILSLWLHHASALHDTDAYFHLAIARSYAQEGIAEDLPALRMSLMRDGYGDKEILFHLLLAPLLKVLPPLAAGRLALALFAGAIAALLAFFAARVIGGWGLLFPFWLFFASTEFTWRLVRLRPELLSLALLLLAAGAIAKGRPALLGLFAAVYTLGYTAFHAFLGLVFLCFAAIGLREEGGDWRRWPWRMPLYAGIGAGAALIVHPHFPKNLVIWWVQNVVFFQEKGDLNVGSEIKPNTTDVVLMVHLGLFAALFILWRSARRRETMEEGEVGPTVRENVRLALVFTVYAAAFGLLYALMSRFSLYFWPFATLAFLFQLKTRGYRLGHPLQLGKRRLPLAAGLAVAALLSAPEAVRQLKTYLERTQLGPGEARVKDREQLASALPPGAKVAADWGPTATYLLWAPQALFLNALDPAFMAVPYPQEQATLRRILDGEERDVPAKAVQILDSDYLAFPAVGHQKLIDQLENDSRAVRRHRGSHLLYEFRSDPDLIVDWRLAPGSIAPPVATEADIAAWPAYPLPPEGRARGIEGYLDGNRIAAEIPCLTLVRDLDAPAAEKREIDWSVAGEATLWKNGEKLLESRGSATFDLPLEPGKNRLTIRLCGSKPGENKGFSWREKA